jgi:multiple sugar transport system ATP-binding protein
VLELTNLLDRKPANLSGGQRQRVAMGRAIVRSPKAFLMDEPLSNLDAKLRVQMRTVVSRLQRRLGTTTVYVTHDQTEAMTLGDRVVIMRAGAVQQVGAPQDLYDNPTNLFVAGFIGSPSMNFLHGAVEDGKLRTAIGDVAVDDRLRAALDSTEAKALIVGIRPEHFEDAGLVDEHLRERGLEFEAEAELVESMGSDKYVYFPLEGEQARSADLEELAADAGATDLPAASANQLVTRLAAESGVREGERLRVWCNTAKLHLFDPETGRHLTR